MKIAFIGTGNMGAAIVPRLLAVGHEVRAWNRTREAVDGIAGVKHLNRPADAFKCDAVISMLSDDRAVRDVFFAPGAMPSEASTAIHIVMSTLSLALVDELRSLHELSGITYVAAPVFGVPSVAASGGLNILVAGPDEAIEAIQPIFDAIGQRTWWLGTDQRRATVAKIAGNMMITQAIESMAEAVALVESYGLTREAFLGVVTQTMFSSPSYQRYARNIVADAYEPGFKLALGLKDANLAVEAARIANLSLPAAEVARDSLLKAFEGGLGDHDWSALAKVVQGQLARDRVGAPHKVRMIVSYTGRPGDRFDREYYMARHIPMVERSWTPLGLESVDVMFPVTGEQAVVAVCLCQFRNADAMHSALASPATVEIMSDVERFTNIVPEQHVFARG